MRWVVRPSRWLRRNPLRPVHWRAQTPHTSVNDQPKQIGQQSTDTERAPAAVKDVPMGPGDTGDDIEYVVTNPNDGTRDEISARRPGDPGQRHGPLFRAGRGIRRRA